MKYWIKFLFLSSLASIFAGKLQGHSMREQSKDVVFRNKDNQLQIGEIQDRSSIQKKIQEDESITIDTRNALQLGNMVKYTTGKDSKKYLNYGCWCGYKGRGKPVDNIDSCCKAHDKCYDKFKKQYKCKKLVYIDTYKWTKEKGEIICRWTSNKCKLSKCQCDRTFAMCMGKYHRQYNRRYTGVWWLFKKIWKCR